MIQNLIHGPPLTLPAFIWRVMASHMVTYFLAGLAAFTLFDYRTLFTTTELQHLMRSPDSPWVAAGQVVLMSAIGVLAAVG